MILPAEGGSVARYEPHSFPPELIELRRWIVWRDEEGRKVPYVADRGLMQCASPTNANDWRTYAEAVAAYEANPSRWSGIGFEFHDSGYVGIDLDGCRNPTTGELIDWAEAIVVRSATYGEDSPSKTGVKLILRGKKPEGARSVQKMGEPVGGGKAPAIEVYDRGRYFTMTGERLPGTPLIVADDQAAIDWLYETYFAKAQSAALPALTTAAPASEDRARIVERAARYVATIPPAVSGQGGHAATFRAALALMKGFALSEGEAWPILATYNASCVPPWEERDLRRKLTEAAKATHVGHGYLLQNNVQSWRPEHDPPAKQSGRDKPAATETALVTRLSDVQPKPVEWLWADRIAIGKLTIISGDPGLGKSFLTLDLAARISNGSPWPDDPSTHAPLGSVVLLSAEDDLDDTIRPRLDAAGADVCKIVALEAIKCQDELGNWERSFDLSRDVERLEAEVVKLADCRLIVVDPISSYLGKTKSHDNAEVRGVLAPLAKMAARHRVAVVAISHLRKGEGQALYRTMGSLAFVAAARAAWAVTRDRNDPTDRRRLFLPLKNNLGPDQNGLAFSLVGAEKQTHIAWERDPVTIKADDALGPPAAPGRKPHDLDEARAFLNAALLDGPRAAKELAEEAQEQHGVSSRTLKRAKKEMGVVSFRETVPGPWSWRLPELADMTADQVGQMQGCQNPIHTHSGTLGTLAKNTGKTVDFDPQNPKGAKLFECRESDPLDDLNATLDEAADLELETTA